MSRPLVDITEVERSLRHIVEPGETFEIRAIDDRDGTLYGYFRDPAIAAQQIAKSCGSTIATYVTMNPAKPALYSRRANRIERATKKQSTTPDAHIVRRTRLRFDVDATPVAGVSSTDAEHEAALFTAWSAACDLAALGWPEPVLEDSGNGAGLIYAIDEKTDDGGLIAKVLARGESRWGHTDNSITVKIDVTNANPARITKVHGTVARKGDNTAERPHRMARIVYAPSKLEPVSHELLETFAAQDSTKAETPKTSSPKTDGNRWDVESWLDKHGVEHEPRFVDSDGRDVWVLKVCPFNSDHCRGEAHVHQESGGKIGAACKHDSCKWGWKDLRIKHEPDAYDRDGSTAQNTNATIAATDIEPEPLRRRLGSPKPYPTAALGEVLGGAAKALHNGIQAPIALCGQSVLAAGSLAVQPIANVAIDGRDYPTSLFMLSIAESGERKSAVDTVALSAHRAIERERIETHAIAVREFMLKKAAHDAAISKAKSKGSLADITAAMEACGEAPEEPASGIMLCSEPTIEALQKLYLSGAASLGLFTDEGATFFGGHAMNADNRMRSIGAICKLWDNGTSDRIRAGDGASKIYGRRLAAHWMMQPTIAEKVLGDEMLAGQGFLARCLLAAPDTTAGTRMYREVNLWADPAIRGYAERMNALVTTEPRFKPGRVGELDPRTLDIGRARGVWRSLHDSIEERMVPGGPFVPIRPWASKGAEMALRIAGVLTIVADPSAAEISVRAMTDAAQLMAWHLSEAVRLIDVATVPAKVKRAEAVMDWCSKHCRNVIDSRTLCHKGPNSVRSSDFVHEAMAVLVLHGWAATEPNAVIDGKHVLHAWRLRLDRWSESQESRESQRSEAA